MNQDQVLAQRIKRAREDAGLSQSRLGEYLRIDQSAVSKIENGTTEVGAIRLMRIAAILGRPVTWFLGIDTELSDEEAEIVHLWRQIHMPAVRSSTLDLLRIQVESDRKLRQGV